MTNSNNLIVVSVGNVSISGELEDLPPLRASAVVLHVVGSSLVVDVKGLVGCSGSNSS